MAEESDAIVVGLGDRGVEFHGCAGGEGGEVVGFVEVFEDGGGGVDVVVGEVDASGCRAVWKLRAGVGEEGRLCEEALMRGEGGGFGAGA